MLRPISFDTPVVLVPQPRIEVMPVVLPEPEEPEYQAVLSDPGDPYVKSDYGIFVPKESEDTSFLPDPVEMVRQAIACDLDSSALSEHRFAESTNIIDWCRGHQWLNASTELFPRQIEVLSRFFEDICYFCSDAEYVHNVPVDDRVGDVLDRFCFLQHGVCPNCKRNRREMLEDWIKDSRYGRLRTSTGSYEGFSWDQAVIPRPVPPNEFVGIWGQRSGKSLLVATFMWTYILHRLLAQTSLPRYYRIMDNAVLEAAFVAPTKHQVEKYMWMPFMNMWDSSPWFKQVTRYLEQESKRLGVSLYRRQQTFIIFPGKRLAVHMLAANSANLRGGTRVFCLVGNTLVNTTKGLIPIEQKQDLINNQIYINGETHAVVTHIDAGKKPVVQVTLRRGFSLTATAQHRLRVLTHDLTVTWKRVGDLVIGDCIAVGLGATFSTQLLLTYMPKKEVTYMLQVCEFVANKGSFCFSDICSAIDAKNIRSFLHPLVKRGMLTKKGKLGGNYNYAITDKFDLNLLKKEMRRPKFKTRDNAIFPTEMTEDLGYLLGYYVSEGSYSENAKIFTFTNTDKRVIDHFVSCFERTFGVQPYVSFCASAQNRKAVYTVVVSCPIIKDFLRYVGLKPSVSHTKSVPWSILQAPKQVVLAFLSAYIEGDGHISTKTICASSCSQRLIKQLQLLLLRLKILSQIITERKAKAATEKTDFHHALYGLRLHRPSAIQLAKLLTCCTKGKDFDFNLSRLSHDDFKVPFLTPYCDASYSAQPKWIYTTSSLNAVHDNYAIDRLQKERPDLHNRVMALQDTDTVWLPVTNLAQLGLKSVYDLTISGDEHAFIANGVVVHNCSDDELGWFNSTEDGKKRASVRDGTEVFTSLERSLRTVRSGAERRRKQLGDFNAIDGYMANISSPSDISDPIEQRASIAPKSFRMFFTRYKTWDVNPNEDEDLIREETAGSPIKFTRDYCAIPPMATNPFIQDEKVIDQIIADKAPRICEVTVQAEQQTEGLALLRPKLSKLIADHAIPRCIAIDNGERKNSFALCVARYYPEQDGMLVEELVEVAPAQGSMVDLASCYNDLILPLVKQLRCIHVVYDQWESSYAVADLRTNHKIDAQRYSLKWKDFELFRQDLLGLRVFMGKPEVAWRQVLATTDLVERAQWPRAHFQSQLATVNEQGKRLTKPLKGNDDLFRTVTLAHYFITKHRELYKHNIRVEGGGHDGDHPVAMFFGRSARGARGSGMSGVGQRPGGGMGMVAGGARRGRR